MIGKNWKRGSIRSGIPSPSIMQLPIIPFGNEHQYSNKTPTVYFGNYLKTETRKMHQLKSQPKLTSKDKELTCQYQDVALSWVSTEVGYTATINDKATKEELKLMSNAQKGR